MTKKKNKMDTILLRAERLFNAGNFLLAEKEFEKIPKRLNENDIEEKLKICRNETRTIKGKELVKKGHKSVNNNKLPEAIAYFQEAEKLLNEPWLTEPWITDKIKELQHRLTRHKIDAKAQEAEASGDYLLASDLYIKAWEKKGSHVLLLKGTICLVKAENYGQAVAMFQKSDLLDDLARYCYGFALAKIGKYYQALKQWENLNTRDNAFIEQKRRVLSLAGSHLYNTLGKEVDVTIVHNMANDLLCMTKAQTNTQSNKEQIPMLEMICSYYKLALMEILWEQENFAVISDLLLQMTFFNDPIMLALNAKTNFHLSREQSRFLEPMMTFWLSAVYSKEISAEFSDDPDKRQKIQQQLIRFAEQHIHCQPDSQSAIYAASRLAIEKKLLKDLSAISQKQTRGFYQICTPQYALMCGSCDTIHDLIRQGKEYFKDQEHYLETGGYYSRAGEGLYALKINDVKKARTLIDTIDSNTPTDEFTDYVISLVQFESGLAALENHEKDYLKNFALTPKLFESVPSIEKRFSDKILQSSGDRLVLYEKLLMFLYKERPSDSIAQALSFAMTQSIIIKHNCGTMTEKQTKLSIEKALKINPNNEFARHALEQTTIDLETETILNAMSKHKLGKAARLVNQSAYPEVYDRYFEFGQQMLDQVDSSGLDLNSQKISLFDLLSASETVDPDHPLIESIKRKIQCMGE